MIKHWNVEDIVRQINSAYYACTDPRMDGFVTWGCKQDLYRIKWILDEALRKCPTYAGEEEWVREYEKTRLVEILKEK